MLRPCRVTRPPPRGSDGSYGPCGPAWTGRPGRPRRLPGRSGGPGFRRVRQTGAAARGCSRHRPRNRRYEATYAVSSGVSFRCRQGVSFECRLTPSSWRRSRSPRSRACTTGPSAAFPWCPSGSATRTRHVLRTIATDAPRYVLGPLFELPLVVSSTGVGGWAEKASRPRGRSKSADGRLTVQVSHRIVRAVLASRLARCYGPRPGPRALTLQAMRERHRRQIERWRTPKWRFRFETATRAPWNDICDTLLHEVAQRSSVPATETTPVAQGCPADRPHGEALQRRPDSLKRSMGERGRKRVGKRPVGVVRVAAGCLLRAQTGGQCAEVVVGRYSTLRRCISASSSRSW